MAGFVANCPLCKDGAGFHRVQILGPRRGHLSIRVHCQHSWEEVLRGAGVPNDLVFDPAIPIRTEDFPEVMPVPSEDLLRRIKEVDKLGWGDKEIQWARLTQFVMNLSPGEGADEAEVVKRAVEILYPEFRGFIAPQLRDDYSIDSLCREVNKAVLKGNPTRFCGAPVGLVKKLIEGVFARFDYERQKEKARVYAQEKELVLKEFLPGPSRELKWLVEGVLVADQPAVLGGPVKCSKTSITLDLAISLASGTPFLGAGPVPRPVRVAVFSGESGEEVLRETALRIARSKGLEGVPAGVQICCRLPRLSDKQDLKALQVIAEDFGAGLVVIDPAYLALGCSSDGLNPASMFDVGPVLRRVAEACLEVNCTPFLLHHTPKNIPLSQPLELYDLAFSGFAEFARQWLLINRRKTFDPERGLHRLILSYGGSAGHSGTRALDVEEGKICPDFSGRTWRATVLTVEEARQRDKESRVQEKAGKEKAEDDKRLKKLLDGCKELDVAVGCTIGHTRLKNAAHFDGAGMAKAVNLAVEEGILELVSPKPKKYRRLQ